MKRWFVPIVETRVSNVEYVVEAETMDEAIRQAESGHFADRYERGSFDVIGRNLDLSLTVEEELDIRKIPKSVG